jgi:hypothetical protein
MEDETRLHGAEQESSRPRIMIEIIDIVGIHGRTAEGNGVSRPFRCEGEDGHDYFVKLKNAGYECLVKEWVAGRLAHEMGLPAAEVRQVKIPPELIAGNKEYENDLGHGVAFGSLKVEAAERLSLEFIRKDVDDSLSRILLFDWWVRNADRALTEIGGNPNLLWEIDPGRVVMIDHDNAFDASFDSSAFRQFHALRGHLGAWLPGLREEMGCWLEAGLNRLDAIWAELPEEWLTDSHGDSRCGLDKVGLKDVLSSFRSAPDFWNIPTSTP